jgi:hypothetical protein
MLCVKCTEKFRNDKNQIVAYRLQDEFGRIKDIYSDHLKIQIRNGDIVVSNLTLTQDNRLIDKVG